MSHSPSRTQQRVLEALAARSSAAETGAVPSREMYGLDLVAAKAASRSSLYVELARLEDLGWIESREEEDQPRLGPPRRLYQITVAGAAALLPHAKALP